MAHKILVIEDEESVRKNLVELLEAEGYECVEARDGEEGVGAAWNELPDLILCDVLMPHLDGFGVLARLSRDAATATIPFIFLTARVERSDQRMGMELGADDYVTKPFSRADILSSIEKRLVKRAEVINQTRQAALDVHDRISFHLPERFLTPLSVILGSAENLTRHVEIRGDAAQVKQTAEVIEKAAHQLIESIENYLFYTDLELIAADPHRKQELCDNVVANAGWEIKTISRVIARKFGREDDLNVESAEARLIMPGSHLYKLMEAVLDNAFQHSSPGSPVHISGRRTETQTYLLRIHDAGQGMYPEQVANLMHMTSFDRLRFVEPHTGLGWMLVRRIVDLNGGQVSLQSRLGEGTLVELELKVEGS